MDAPENSRPPGRRPLLGLALLIVCTGLSIGSIVFALRLGSMLSGRPVPPLGAGIWGGEDYFRGLDQSIDRYNDENPFAARRETRDGMGDGGVSRPGRPREATFLDSTRNALRRGPKQQRLDIIDLLTHSRSVSPMLKRAMIGDLRIASDDPDPEIAWAARRALRSIEAEGPR